mmetsp:Transcript_52626/g.150114  ORF Transcript_52626/g.150114 Transcript_52626/m.150114 type:complete len:144 (+) Transcript_52626:1-432(+)
MVLYGMWGFLGKLAQVRGLTSEQEMILNKVGFFTGLAFMTALASGRSSSSAAAREAGGGGSMLSRPKSAIGFSLLSGLLCSIASTLYSRAMGAGDSTAVAAITAAYAPINVALGRLFLKEQITANKLLGTLFSLLSTCFFSRA